LKIAVVLDEILTAVGDGVTVTTEIETLPGVLVAVFVVPGTLLEAAAVTTTVVDATSVALAGSSVDVTVSGFERELDVELALIAVELALIEVELAAVAGR
jgi:hypothetical protein